MNYWINKFWNNPFFTAARLHFFFFLFTITACGPVLSQRVHLLTGAASTEFVNHDFQYWENTASNRQDVRFAAHQSFSDLPNLYPNFGFVTHDVWFRFVLKNPTGDTVRTLFRLSNPNLDEIDLYQKRASWELLSATGDNRPFESRKFKNRNFIIPVAVLPHACDTFLLRANNGGEQFHFVPSLVSYSYFLEQDADTQLYFGIYFGIIAFIIIFNLFSYIALGDRTALWYASYVFCLGMLQLSLVGIGAYRLWGGEYLSDRANPFFASTSVLFLLYFCMDYLKTREIMPKIHRFFLWFRAAIFACIVFSLIPMDVFYKISVVGINGITFVLNIIILPVAYIAVRKNVREAKLFLLAFAVLTLAVFGFILKNFGIVPSSFLTDFGMQIGSSLESILLSIGIVLKYKSTRETAIRSLRNLNELTEKANVVLEEKVALRTQEVEKQKSQLEYKNEQILSSIAYAQRIQDSLLPSLQQIHGLLPDSVLWYAPKDIVAGDFYWVNERMFKDRSWIFFAVGDCTGHGVPGAMMSVLCVNALESAFKELDGPDPGVLLEKAADFLNANLSSGNHQLTDGMDISMGCINLESKMLHWSGANNPLWLLRASEIVQYAPTKRPVGRTDIETPFATNLIQLQAKDRLFLFSDGYVDQFGGVQNKKFKRGNFVKVIERHSGLDPIEQMMAIQAAFYNWKGNEEQVDDICIFQVEIS